MSVGPPSNDPGRPRHEYYCFCFASIPRSAGPNLSDDSRRERRAACVSGDIYAEYEEVIRRAKFGRSEIVIEQALQAIRQNGFWVRPSEKVTACSDPDDDIFLECAQAARAHYLVTENSKHFPTKWDETQIVTVRQFFEATGSSQGGPKHRPPGSKLTP